MRNGRGRIAGGEGPSGPRRVLDASAFYAGLPLRSTERFATTPEILDEVRHIKKAQDAFGVLVQTGRLDVRDAGRVAAEKVAARARETGDYAQLSRQDISILALSLETGGHLITDDFAVSNVARNLGIAVVPVMTGGIRTVGRWIHYCIGCRRSFKGTSECPLCGNKLSRKLLEG